ncbi:hypothetical protein [Arenimonas fontis]|uniref:Histone deacetylase domain-containing protein n=1 Tax=Arenimonas fontis TaxID=2608255 RepID=A0A5B2ZB12_9GAMM|nr:hypothetical protein [Arenimonas fontis]KAA2285239.1 hypothetical protein F0415_04785 [Arenimonas fontis]
MKAFYCHRFVLPLPDGHRFPMAKYARLYRRVAAMADLWGIELLEPPAVGERDLLRVHDREYVRAMLDGSIGPEQMRRIGFPWSAAMVERSRRSAGGTLQALRAALAGDGVAVNLAGGTHHAGRARGGGYCVFNDAVIAARHAQAHGLAERDRRVLAACRERGLPVAVCMAGGYAPEIEDIVDIHAATVAVAARFARQPVGAG